MLCACRDCQNFSPEEICEDDNKATHYEEDEDEDEDESNDDESDEESDEGTEEEQNVRIDDDDGNVFDLFIDDDQSEEEW